MASVRPSSPEVFGPSAHHLAPEADALRREVSDFAARIARYMATSDKPWVNLDDTVQEAVRLVFEDAFFETYPLVKRRMEVLGRD